MTDQSRTARASVPPGRCPVCGGPLFYFEGECYCPECLRWELAPLRQPWEAARRAQGGLFPRPPAAGLYDEGL